MLDYLRKHTIVIMAAMALVFVGLMFVGGDVSGGSLTGMFKQTFVSVDGKSYGEKDYNNMGRTGLSVAFSFPSTFGPLLQDNFSSEENLRELCHLLKTNNPNAAFLAYRGIIRREAGRLGLTPSTAEIDDAICNIPEFQDDKGVFDPKNTIISFPCVATWVKASGGTAARSDGRHHQPGAHQGRAGRGYLRGARFCRGCSGIQQPANYNQHRLPGKKRLPPQDGSRRRGNKTFWDKHKENYKNEEARFFTVYTFIPAGDAQAPKPGDISNATMETMNLVENDIWEPLNATNGRNMDQAISEALAKAPGVCKMEKKSYTAVTRKNAPQEINQAINQSASDGRSANLLDVAFSLAGAPALNADADAKAIEEARAKTGAEQISTMQVLENGQVVLIRLEGITPVKALPYETARNSARADLLESMTVESINKAATELNTELQKAENPVEQFNAIAGKAGAKTASYGPFVNPNVLLSSVNLQNAKTQEELQSLLERAMNSRLAPPKELPAPEEVFQAASVINPGQMAQPINTGDGILLTQLVKRELEDTPEFQIKSTQQIAPALTAQAKSMIMLDWLKACITQYKVEIAPILNQEH